MSMSTYMQRHERRCSRRRVRRRAREEFLKNPYEATKKLLTEAWSGKLKCTKEELDAHVRQTYSDPNRDEPLSDMRGLKRPTAPGVSYQLGPIREKEVDEFIRKARAKSAPGGDGISYKVMKYCDKQTHHFQNAKRPVERQGDCQRLVQSGGRAPT